MNDTFEWIAHAVHETNAFLSTPSALRAVLFGLLLSWSTSQVLKFLPSLMAMSDPTHKVVVRWLAFCLAYFPVVMLWPGSFAERMLAGVITGLCAPTAYALLARALYHFFPWLEARMSAKPQDSSSE